MQGFVTTFITFWIVIDVVLENTSFCNAQMLLETGNRNLNVIFREGWKYNVHMYWMCIG